VRARSRVIWFAGKTILSIIGIKSNVEPPLQTNNKVKCNHSC
jgi:hypothetical protein